MNDLRCGSYLGGMRAGGVPPDQIAIYCRGSRPSSRRSPWIETVCSRRRPSPLARAASDVSGSWDRVDRAEGPIGGRRE